MKTKRMTGLKKPCCTNIDNVQSVKQIAIIANFKYLHRVSRCSNKYNYCKVYLLDETNYSALMLIEIHM